MKTIYIDNDCKCYIAPGEGLREFDVPFFDNKCDEFVEGYRYVPAGETWTRSDGMEFYGEMISPWKPMAELEAAQAEYERQELKRLRIENAEYEAALSAIENALGVTTE